MSLLLIDEARTTVTPVSDAEWRMIRLRRLLGESDCEVLHKSLCERVVDRWTKPSNADEDQCERDTRLNFYIPMAISQSRPAGYSSDFDFLLERGYISEIFTFQLMVGGPKTVDSAAEFLYRAYVDVLDTEEDQLNRVAMENDADDSDNDHDGEPVDRGTNEVEIGRYPDSDGSRDDFLDNMRSVITEWQDRFTQRLEKYAADLRLDHPSSAREIEG